MGLDMKGKMLSIMNGWVSRRIVYDWFYELYAAYACCFVGVCSPDCLQS